LANPSERRNRDSTLRSKALYLGAQTAAAQGGGFHHSSWTEVARGVKTVLQRPVTSNVVKAGFGMGLGLLCPPLAVLASTVVDSLNVVGDAIMDLAWEQIESRLWQMVDKDPMADVHGRAGTDLKSDEIVTELQEQLAQVVTAWSAIDKLQNATIVYCDDLHNYAFMFETMKANIEKSRDNAALLKDFLDKVLTVLPSDAQVQQMETKVRQQIESKIDVLGNHYDGAWIRGRTGMCSNVHCQGPV
jgi:hypothetical protein